MKKPVAFGSLLLLTTTLVAPAALAQDREPVTVRVGMQAVGTFSWVVHAMQYFGVDEEYALNLEPITYATKQATELALRGDEVDVVVDDFVGAVQMRERGVVTLLIDQLAEEVGVEPRVLVGPAGRVQRRVLHLAGRPALGRTAGQRQHGDRDHDEGVAPHHQRLPSVAAIDMNAATLGSL